LTPPSGGTWERRKTVANTTRNNGDDQAQRFDRSQLGQLGADDPARLRGQDRGQQRDTDP
jgi:hypothetical protein